MTRITLRAAGREAGFRALIPTHPHDGSPSGEEFDESEFWQAVHDDEDSYVRENPDSRPERHNQDHLRKVSKTIRSSKLASAEAQEESITDFPMSVKHTFETPTATEAT